MMSYYKFYAASEHLELVIDDDKFVDYQLRLVRVCFVGMIVVVVDVEQLFSK